MPMISLKNTNFSYKGAQTSTILEDLNLDIEKGELLAIKGSSGSGKSTLLHIMGCLHTADSGSLILDGIELSPLNSQERAILRNQKIGFVFQQFELVPKTSVLDNILLPTFYPCELKISRHDTKQRALALAERLGLSKHLHHFPNQLSGGQKQRVAIARALINEPAIILADEPTGNLDTKNSQEILKIFQELNNQGKTIVVITHEQEVANRCSRVVEIRDGKLLSSVSNEIKNSQHNTPLYRQQNFKRRSSLGFLLALLPFAFFNLKRNKLRSLLTMLGITIGISAVVAMTALGQFTKRTLLEGYEALGVNRIIVSGWPNWSLKATDLTKVSFRSFSLDDVKTLPNLFPEIEFISPVIQQYGRTARFAGRQIESTLILGVNSEYFTIANRHFLLGHPFRPLEIARRSPVCVIGFEVANRLFRQNKPLGKIIYFGNDQTSTSCRVIGVLKSQKSNSEWIKPDQQILVPYTLLHNKGDFWESGIQTIASRVKRFEDLEKTGKRIQSMFKNRYGETGVFSIDQDDIMVSQIKKFLNIFALLLTCIALISLIVGGIGIMNMMLVSVAERFREIGLRKAFGASNIAIRFQFLLESLMLCFVSGALGIIVGFASYEGIIYTASRFSTQVKFEWFFEPWAFIVSFVGIVLVGILSGIAPALKAERLEITEALRSE